MYARKTCTGLKPPFSYKYHPNAVSFFSRVLSRVLLFTRPFGPCPFLFSDQRLLRQRFTSSTPGKVLLLQGRREAHSCWRAAGRLLQHHGPSPHTIAGFYSSQQTKPWYGATPDHGSHGSDIQDQSAARSFSHTHFTSIGCCFLQIVTPQTLQLRPLPNLQKQMQRSRNGLQCTPKLLCEGSGVPSFSFDSNLL